jgi:putative PIN family toxin of toxin-antitoxin system
MITAVVDTNILVQYLLSSSGSASARTVEAYFDGHFRLAYSSAIFDEVLEVLMLPQIRQRHGLDDAEILEYLASLLVDAVCYSGALAVSARTTRDITDTKFLSVAAEAHADYLITNDRRHLLPLKRFRGTRIVTPARFLSELPRSMD